MIALSVSEKMKRCIHLYLSGQQCEREAFPGDDFCEDHADMHVVDDELVVEEHPFKKLIMRAVALALLLMFLIPVYYTAKTLYLAYQAELQEGG